MNYTEMGTTALGKLVAERTGKPCNSRNKPALVRKLEAMDKEAGGSQPIDVEKAAAVVAEASAPAPKRARKPKPAAPRARAIHSDPDLHAPALAYVRRAMVRKQPPALRELCAELEGKGIKTPWGRKKWWPSSIQSLMRQAKEGK